MKNLDRKIDMWTAILALAKKYIVLIIIVAIIIIQAIAIYLLIKSILDKDDHIKTLQYDLFQQSEQYQKMYVTKDEFKDLVKSDTTKYAELMKWLAEKGLKPSNVTELTKIDKYYQTDSITIIQPVRIINEGNPSDTGKYQFNFNDGCLQYTGQFDCSEQQYTHIKGSFTDETDIMEYQQRRKLFGANWLPRWGKKEIFREVNSKCGEAKTEQIVIGKKPKD